MYYQFVDSFGSHYSVTRYIFVFSIHFGLEHCKKILSKPNALCFVAFNMKYHSTGVHFNFSKYPQQPKTIQNTIDYPDTCAKACVTIRLIVMMLRGGGSVFVAHPVYLFIVQGFCSQLTARLNGEHRLECITLDCANEHVNSCRAE